ncbi:MAG: flagella basal body P-ring formation protein FlgA [Gammaproteobacteria bacterium]|nr:MAG: flagella basal body P-ring formation protein FlgA [Gammaproteobacteria bacterium]
MRFRILSLGLLLCSAAWADTGTGDAPDSGLTQAYEALDAHLLKRAEQESAAHQRELKFTIRELDARLSLKTCKETPQVQGGLNLQRKRQTLAVSCDGGWTVRIPIELEVMAPVLITARTLFRGQALNKADIDWKKVDLTAQTRGYIEPGQDWQGMRVRRTLREGQVITPSALQPPLLVSKGERVVIEAGNGQFSVKMMGEALTNGVRGQQIPVRNLTSRRVVRAEVVARQRVRVRM